MTVDGRASGCVCADTQTEFKSQFETWPVQLDAAREMANAAVPFATRRGFSAWETSSRLASTK